MPLVKSSNAPASLKPFSMADIESAARSMLLKARCQAEALLAEAQREAEMLKESARAEGMALGLEQGLQEGHNMGAAAGQAEAFEKHGQEFTTAIDALKSAAIDMEARRFDLEAEGLHELVRLAAAIARRVTKRQGILDEQVLIENLRGAMKLAVWASDVRVAIHPRQRTTLEAALPALRSEWPALKHLELVEDESLAEGGCRVFTRGGSIDADLSTQLDRVIAELLPTSE